MVVPKFRAWDVLARKMIRELLLISYVRNEIIGKYENGSNSNPLKIREEVILMQSTGLFDKNGKEIFENDIVRFHTPQLSTIGVVEFDKNEACFKVRNDFGGHHVTMFHVRYFEVIGCVYQNPELLEVENERRNSNN